jgi:hypothetical protein
MFLKFKISGTLVCNFPAILLALICLYLPTLVNSAKTAYAEDLKEKIEDFSKIQESSSFLIKPISRITFQDFYYSDHADRPYCFENSEGRCLDKQNNLFTTLEGNGQFKNRLYVYYKSEVNGDSQIRLKKGYVLLKAGIWSIEAGQDTIWIGPGYHGSFLLSNNAEGFPLVRIRTEEPFRLPWIFSTIGEFKYDIFQGWYDNMSLLGHRLSLRPVRLLEIGFNQVVYIPPGKHYQIYEYPHVLVSAQDHSGTEQETRFNNDHKASIDIALDMPFLSKLPPLKNGKIYAEYGGNDSFNMLTNDKHHMRDTWLHSRTKWFQPIPFDFQDIAWMAGLFLTTGDIDFRFEFAQNYASYPLFYDFYLPSTNRRAAPWYTGLNTYHGLIMGHEMGNAADDYYFELNFRRNRGSLKIYYDQEQHGLSANVSYPPEQRYEYGLRPAYKFDQFIVFADLIYNHYKNVNYSSDPTTFSIHPGTTLDEFIAGLGVAIGF